MKRVKREPERKMERESERKWEKGRLIVKKREINVE